MAITRKELNSLKSLLSRKGRREQAMFSAEGVRLLEEALRFQLLPEKVFYSESLLADRGRRLVKQLEKQSIPLVSISARDLRSVSDTESPQGIIGIFSTPEIEFGKLYHSRVRKILLCEQVADPGNLGTLIRSAAAFEFELVVLLRNCVEPYSPKVIRASMGAIFSTGIVEAGRGVIARLKQEGFVLVALDVKGDRFSALPRERSRKLRMAVVVGSESQGLSKSIIEAADYRVRIEHSDKVESLNAAIAGSIVMKEVYTRSGRR